MRMAPRPRRRRHEGRPIEVFQMQNPFPSENRTNNFTARWICLIIILTTGFYLARLKKLR
jgi:hypothetical protein